MRMYEVNIASNKIEIKLSKLKYLSIEFIDDSY